MNFCIILLTAMLPIAVLLFYIYRKDKNSPEPIGQLLKAFFIGVLAAPLSLCISTPLESLGLYTMEPESIIGAISTYLFSWCSDTRGDCQVFPIMVGAAQKQIL